VHWQGSLECPNTRYGGTAANPHIVFEDFRRGYVHVDLDHATWRTDFRVVEHVRSSDAPASTLASFVVENGKPGAALDVRY
jgi:alkaline phosphatase D